MNSKNQPGVVIIEGHVQGLANTRSLGEAGIPVYVVDTKKCIAGYSKYCQKFLLCPDFISSEFAPFLITMAIKEKIKSWVLLPSNDHAVRSIAKHKSELCQYFKIITPNLDVINNIYDKSRLLAIAEQCNIPIPMTRYFKSINKKTSSDLNFPVITKGKYGLSFYKTFHKKAFLANNENELKGQLELISENYNIEDTFTQELIPFEGCNRTISFTAFCVKGDIKTYWMGVKLREHPLRFGTATFAKSINIPECYHLSTLLLKALNYTGVCEVEYLFDPRTNQYKLIEINARTWLWVGLARACGIDFAKIIYDYVNHKDIKYPKSYDTNKYWINPITDTVYAIVGILKGKIQLKDLFSSLFDGPKTNALFIKSDLKPGFAYILNLFSFLKNR